MLDRKIAIISETDKVKADDLAQVAAALSKQSVRDLGPVWSVDAPTVAAFSTQDDAPPDYWRILLQDPSGGEDYAGYHDDDHGQPYSIVLVDGDDWPVTASHECAEMLCDPFGRHLYAAQSIKSGQGRVRYLVEVSDPVESVTYEIDGVKVSDFVTPAYYYTASPQNTRFSFLGSVKHSRALLAGGYVSWLDKSGRWWMADKFSGDSPAPRIRQLSVSGSGSLRSQVDRAVWKIKREESGISVGSR